MHQFNVDQNRNRDGLTRYATEYTNAIWHGDIHFFRNDQSRPIFGLIDDKSRFKLFCSRVSDKTAKTVKNAFQKAIDAYGIPYTYWSDNGGENQGDELI